MGTNKHQLLGGLILASWLLQSKINEQTEMCLADLKTLNVHLVNRAQGSTEYKHNRSCLTVSSLLKLLGDLGCVQVHSFFP
jgi:hypothetical protein